MAEYLVLIYGDESAWEHAEPGTTEDVHKGHQAFGERKAKSLRGGNALQSVQDAYTRALAAWPESGLPARPGA